jgi:hypothetical protein
LEGVDEAYRLSEDLVTFLHNKEIFSLWDTKIQNHNCIGRNGWKIEDEFSLSGEKVVEWHNFMEMLCSNHIMLIDEEPNALAWSSNDFTGEYTTRLGYNALMEDVDNEPPTWWWEQLWKLHGLLK